MSSLIAIVGPTATGKTTLAIELAEAFNGEIVSADSRQVYRHMDIGTAKPTPEQRARVPHHLVDIVGPDEDFSLARYRKEASRTISDILERGRLPLLVGGSGLYVWAVLEGWQVPAVPPDTDLRHRLQLKAETGGADELYRELARLDPTAAQRIDPRNIRRVIRALEVTLTTGTGFSRLQAKEAPPFDSLLIGLTAEREELYRRVDRRVDAMMERGLVDEVKRLMDMGYDLRLPAMSGIGYRQVGLFLKGELSLADAVQRIKHETHRLVRHQYAWFRLTDERIRWFDIQDARMTAGVTEAVAEFLERGQRGDGANNLRHAI